MSNRFLGEVKVTAADRTWTLRIDFNAMCAFEDMTGKDALQVFEGIDTGAVGVKDMRAIMHACMLRHHPDATAQDAGDVLSEAPEVLTRLVQAAMPSAAEAGTAEAASSGNA